MALKNIPTARLREITEYAEKNGYEATKEVFGVSIETMKRYKREFNKRNAVVMPTERENLVLKEQDIRKDTQSLTVLSSTRATSAEEIAKKYEIDLTVWRPERIRANEWNTSDDFLCWQLRVDFSRIKGFCPEVALQAYKKVIESYETPPRYIPIIPSFRDIALEIMIPDLHLGRLAWGKETGEAYDVKIAYEEWMKAHRYFYGVYAEEEPEIVLIPIGNDFFNVDSNNNMTNAGTPQTEDGRYQRSFEYGERACVAAIDLWREKAKVKVIIVPGNHDTQRAYYLGQSLASWYRNDAGVEIDNSPKHRKYHVFGSNLIGYSHGQKDAKRLTTIFQEEMWQYLSQCRWVEWHVAHRHGEHMTRSYGNCTVRTIDSLASRGAWESEMGYGSLRGSQAFKWSKTNGLLSTEYYTPV